MAVAGAALLVVAGPAFAGAQSQARADTVDLSCKVDGSVKFNPPMTDTAQEIGWSSDFTMTGCEDAAGQDAAVGDGSGRAHGTGTFGCNAEGSADSDTQEIFWSNGEETRASGTVAFFSNQNGEDLMRLTGTVVSGAYEGDQFRLTMSAGGTTAPEACGGSGVAEATVAGTLVAWH